jgi:hypothetical protein
MPARIKAASHSTNATVMSNQDSCNSFVKTWMIEPALSDIQLTSEAIIAPLRKNGVLQEFIFLILSMSALNSFDDVTGLVFF